MSDELTTVLCFTHTRGAADEMRGRLGGALDGTRRLEIRTVHSFCLSTINAYFGSSRAVVPVRQDTQVQLFLHLAATDTAGLTYALNEVGVHRTHLFLDEMQDCSEDQLHVLAHLLLLWGARSCVVGDDNQCIYEFAGARAGLLRHVLGAQHGIAIAASHMNVNRRSSAALVALHNALLRDGDEAHVPIECDRGEVHLCQEYPQHPTLHRFETRSDELDGLVGLVGDVRRRAPASPDGICVLHRTNDGCEAAWERLVAAGIETAFVDEDAACEGGQTAPGRPVVRVGTIHAAKGKEWSCVILMGAGDDIIPGVCFDESPPDESWLAAARRLLYVAISRARDELHVTYSASGHTGRPARLTRLLSFAAREGQNIDGGCPPMRICDARTLDLDTLLRFPRAPHRPLCPHGQAKAACPACQVPTQRLHQLLERRLTLREWVGIMQQLSALYRGGDVVDAEKMRFELQGTMEAAFPRRIWNCAGGPSFVGAVSLAALRSLLAQDGTLRLPPSVATAVLLASKNPGGVHERAGVPRDCYDALCRANGVTEWGKGRPAMPRTVDSARHGSPTLEEARAMLPQAHARTPEGLRSLMKVCSYDALRRPPETMALLQCVNGMGDAELECILASIKDRAQQLAALFGSSGWCHVHWGTDGRQCADIDHEFVSGNDAILTTLTFEPTISEECKPPLFHCREVAAMWACAQRWGEGPMRLRLFDVNAGHLVRQSNIGASNLEILLLQIRASARELDEPTPPFPKRSRKY